MKRMFLTAGIALVTAVLMARPLEALQNGTAGKPTAAELEQKIWKLLDNDKAVYVSLPEPDFMALGEGFDLPDGGKNVTDLAVKAPGGAFDPRDVAKIPVEK